MLKNKRLQMKFEDAQPHQATILRNMKVRAKMSQYKYEQKGPEDLTATSEINQRKRKYDE